MPTSAPFVPLRESALPLYDQVVRWLLEVIERDFVHEERFFTERDLIVRLQVSQPTVRRALQELVNRGLLYRHVGRGTFVQKRARTRLLGVIMPQHSSPVLGPQLNAFAGVCDAFDCRLRVHYVRRGESLRDLARALKADPHEERFVFLGHSQTAALTLFDELEHRGFRTVSALPFAGGYPGNCVSTDSRLGAELAMGHLVGLGHRRIAVVVNEPSDLANVRVRLDRLQEIVSLTPGVEVEFHDCATPHYANSFEAACAVLPAILDRPDRPTALLPISGVGAWAVLKHAGRVGLRVPEDLSVFAFDDLPGGELLWPALTALRVDGERFARRILEILWSDDPAIVQETQAPSVVVRSSTGAAPPASAGPGFSP
jgi:LacI family transcriptional regulator